MDARAFLGLCATHNRYRWNLEVTSGLITNGGFPIPEMIEYVDATALAVLGDYVPSGVGQALGRLGGGNSLDNTLRVARLVRFWRPRKGARS